MLAGANIPPRFAFDSSTQPDSMEIPHKKAVIFQEILQRLLAGFVNQTGRINFSLVGRAIRELEGNI